ncbi:transglutaminase-like cysteine peptidase [Aquabacterium sp.]|uniref:transglutaminase-like cysteine peptidase n=1 Tax=Aquabacterium sp. TaxID=1872578 RepID=UPI003D6CD62A
MGAWLLRLAVLASLMLGAAGSAFESQKIMAAAQRMGPATSAQAQALIQEIAEVASVDEVSRLKRLNTFFNRRVDYREDREVWGQVDYWATPLEMLNKGAGDCEDYAIGKYLSLIAAGVSPAKMRLVYVRAEVGGAILAHMVLAYYPEPMAEPLILDNLITDIRPASRRPDLAPVFSFNAEGLWQGVGSTTAGDPVARLSRWRELLTKTRAEGWW